MRRTLLLFAFLTFVPSIATADDLTDSTEAKVIKIVSGDEFVVEVDKKRVTVRVLGIDCNGQSRAAATQLIGRKTIVLRSDKGFLPILQDQKGRYVAYVQTTDGDDFGAEMLKTKHCSTADWKIPHPRIQTYASLSR